MALNVLLGIQPFLLIPKYVHLLNNNKQSGGKRSKFASIMFLLFYFAVF